MSTDIRQVLEAMAVHDAGLAGFLSCEKRGMLSSEDALTGALVFMVRSRFRLLAQLTKALELASPGTTERVLAAGDAAEKSLDDFLARATEKTESKP